MMVAVTNGFTSAKEQKVQKQCNCVKLQWMKQETFHTWVGINNLANGEKITIHKTNSKYCKEKKIKKEEESLKKI